MTLQLTYLWLRHRTLFVVLGVLLLAAALVAVSLVLTTDAASAAYADCIGRRRRVAVTGKIGGTSYVWQTRCYVRGVTFPEWVSGMRGGWQWVWGWRPATRIVSVSGIAR